MKTKILTTLYYFNVFVLILYALGIILIFTHTVPKDLLLNESVLMVRLLANVILIVFWIYCFKILSRNDKTTTNFFLLFLLNVIYCPFYFTMAKRNNWVS